MDCINCGNKNVTKKFCPKCGLPMPKPSKVYLDGTPMDGETASERTTRGPDPAMSGVGAAFNPPKPTQKKKKRGIADLERAHEEKKEEPEEEAPKRAPKPKRKEPATAAFESSGAGERHSNADSLIPRFEPEEAGFFDKLKYAVTDVDSFYSQADLAGEAGSAAGAAAVVYVAYVVLAFLIQGFLGAPDMKLLVSIMVRALVFPAYPLVLAIVGLFPMTIFFGQAADPRQLFTTYAFCSAPLILSALSIPLLFAACLFFTIYITSRAFGSGFGQTSFGCFVFGALLPLAYWVFVMAVLPPEFRIMLLAVKF